MEHLTRILFELFAIFLAAKLAGEIFERLHQPAVIGEILAGILLGPHLLGLVNPSEILDVFAEIGVIILLFTIGLQTKVEDLLRVGWISLFVGVLGIALPFILGFALLKALNYKTVEALFVGTAMVATSVGITARVFADIGVLKERTSQIILGAAVIDDILGMLFLAVVSGLGEGTISYVHLGIVFLEAAGFVLFLIFVGRRLIRRVVPEMNQFKSRNAPFSLAILFCLGLSAMANYLQIAAIVGAFMAGMVLAEFNLVYGISVKSESLYDFLVPFFFVVMGTKVDLQVFLQGQGLGLALGITLLAIVGKLVGCGLAASGLGFRSALTVGVGMVPRGEVGIIVAKIGLSLHTIGTNLYAVVIFMVLATTLSTPPFLRRLAVAATRKSEVPTGGGLPEAE